MYVVLDSRIIIILICLSVSVKVTAAHGDDFILDIESKDSDYSMDLISTEDDMEIRQTLQQNEQDEKVEKSSLNTKNFTPRVSGRDLGKACESAIRQVRGGLATRGAGLCYRGVKYCLKKAGLYKKGYLNDYVGSSFLSGDGTKCNSYKQMLSAKCAHKPLTNIGMKRIEVKSAKDAPIGSVLVYGGGPHGHIEVVGLDKNGEKKYYSDFVTSRPITDYHSGRKLIGVYVP